MKYNNAAKKLLLEIETLMKELNKQKTTLKNIKVYRTRKNNVKRKYNSTVNEFKRNHNQIYKNIGKTPKKLNSVPKVKNMNEALQNVWWNQYSKPTTPFENRLSGAIQKVQNSKKTKPSNVSNILNQGNFNSNETSQIKKLFPNQQVDSDRRLNVLSKLKGRKVGAILTYENAVQKEKQKRAARVQSNQTATADFEKRRVQNLLKNSGIKVTQSTSSTQKKVTVGK